jgi:integrase
VIDISAVDVEGLHLELTKAKPIRANRVLSLLSTIFALAIKRKMRVDNPAKGISRNREVRRERYLTIDEIRRLVDGLESWSVLSTKSSDIAEVGRFYMRF